MHNKKQPYLIPLKTMSSTQYNSKLENTISFLFLALVVTGIIELIKFN